MNENNEQNKIPKPVVPHTGAVKIDSVQKPSEVKDASVKTVNEAANAVKENPKKVVAVKKTDKPQKKKAPKPKKSGSAKGVLITFVIIGIVGILAFYGLLLWGLLGGELSNPLFRSLDIAPADLKETLQILTSIIFGGLSLIFLISTLVKFFQWLMLPVTSVIKKQKAISAGATFFLFLFIVGIWFGLYTVIDQAQATKVEVPTEQIIATKPNNVIGLTAPITVEFDIGTVLFDKIPQKDIQQINWDFDGDGTVDGSGPLVTHRYLDKGENNGVFPVTAEVIYKFGPQEEQKKLIQTRDVIISNEEVQAVIVPSSETGPMPLKVEFNASESVDPDGQIVYYEWDLNEDGEYEISGEDALVTEKTFGQIGDHIVSLRVTGTNNDTAVISQKITVTRPEENIRAEISSNDKLEGFAPLEVTLSGENSFYRLGKVVRYEWLVEGEDKVVVNRKITRTFREPGEYTVRLTVENDIGERNETESVITVLEAQKDVELKVRTTPAKDAKEDTLYGRAPFEVTFDAASSRIGDAVQWGWDFENDGIIDSYGVATKHVFRTSGTYDVRLHVVDTDNKEYEVVLPVEVSARGLEALINANPIAGEVPLKVVLDGSGSSADGGQIISYMWEIPDAGVINTSSQLTYEFDRIGVFPVKLTVMNSKGDRDSTETLIAVRGKSLKAHFTPTLFSAPVGTEIKFDSLSTTGSVGSYIWKFGDGNTSTSITPKHIYNQPGTYKVVLRVQDLQGVISEHTEEIEITPSE